MTRLFQTAKNFSISLAVTVFFLFYSLIKLLPSSFLLQDPDTFWHISTGQWILDHAQFPTIDFYSYTAAGKPWIAIEWLSEIIFAVAFKFGGWRGVVALAAISCAAVIGILCFYLLRNLRFSVAIGWTAVTGLAISSHFLARPHIFSYVLIAIWMINLLDAYDLDDFNFPSLLTFAPLMALWANLHGSFTFGLALLYVFAGFCLWQNIAWHNYAKCWRLMVVVFVVTLSALMTPYGISSALMTKELLDMKVLIAHIGELHSPDFQKDPIHLILFVALLSAMVGLGIRLRGARLIAFGIIAFMGLTYTRGLVMFFLIAPFILARPASTCAWYLAPQLSDTLSSETDNASDPMLRYLRKRLIAVPACCMAVAALVTISTWWLEDPAPPNAITPKAAIDFVRRTNITGNVLNDYMFGGFLIFSGIPTFVDGRDMPFGDAFLHKYFDAVDLVDIDGAFYLLDDYKVSWIILNPLEPLTKAIAQSTLWDKVYSDEYSVVFIRHRS
jgi:hypothetical protein